MVYGPAQRRRINAKPGAVCFRSHKGELTQLRLCNCFLLLPGDRRGQQDPGTLRPSLTVPGSAQGIWGCSFLALFVAGKSPRGPPAVTSSWAQPLNPL